MKIDLEQIIQSLPGPNESYEWQGIKFDIYLAKNFFAKQWCNETLHFLVLKCRESFLRYGDVALEDDYDQKSLVVVVGVSYLIGERSVKEWVTIRLVPADGSPFLSEDLQVKFADQQNLFEKIKEKLLDKDVDAQKRLFTISRFCGIFPYYQDDFESVTKSEKLKFTLLSFVLLCRFSLKQIYLADDHFYITAMFHHNIFERLKFFEHNKNKYSFELPDIHETLSIEKTEATNFFPGQVAFHYPTYFFRIKELVAWVKKMAIGGHLTNHHLILESDDEWSEIEKTLNENKLRIVSKFAKLGELLVDEKIKESLIEEVPLALLLKLSHQSELLKRIGVFLKDINFYE